MFYSKQEKTLSDSIERGAIKFLLNDTQGDVSDDGQGPRQSILQLYRVWRDHLEPLPTKTIFVGEEVVMKKRSLEDNAYSLGKSAQIFQRYGQHEDSGIQIRNLYLERDLVVVWCRSYTNSSYFLHVLSSSSLQEVFLHRFDDLAPNPDYSLSFSDNEILLSYVSNHASTVIFKLLVFYDLEIGYTEIWQAWRDPQGSSLDPGTYKNVQKLRFSSQFFTVPIKLKSAQIVQSKSRALKHYLLSGQDGYLYTVKGALLDLPFTDSARTIEEKELFPLSAHPLSVNNLLQSPTKLESIHHMLFYGDDILYVNYLDQSRPFDQYQEDMARPMFYSVILVLLSVLLIKYIYAKLLSCQSTA